MKSLMHLWIISFLGIMFLPLVSSAQYNDAALWTNVYLQKNLSKKWNTHVNFLSRFQENYTQLGYAYADFGVTYRVTKWLNSTVDYVFVQRRKHEYFVTRHQMYADLVFKYDIRRYRFLYRIMYQRQYREKEDRENHKIIDHVFRNKFTVKYELNKYFTPYIAQEFYYLFNAADKNTFYRSRSFVGVFYNLSKRTSLELYYVIQKDFNRGMPKNTFALGIGFSHLFRNSFKKQAAEINKDSNAL